MGLICRKSDLGLTWVVFCCLYSLHSYCGGIVFYTIAGITGERSYDSDKYFSNSVVRMMIDDHNVPTLESMLEFVDDVQQWMDKDRNNIIAIHCKG